MYGDIGDQMIFRGDRGAEVEDAEAGVGGDGGDDGGIVRGESGGIGTRADGKGLEGLATGRRPLSRGEKEEGKRSLMLVSTGFYLRR